MILKVKEFDYIAEDHEKLSNWLIELWISNFPKIAVDELKKRKLMDKYDLLWMNFKISHISKNNSGEDEKQNKIKNTNRNDLR